ncbi:MAG: insulinase family protein [Bacillota bacterium]|nr:insulinase family protein [Bacillota bacterium]
MGTDGDMGKAAERFVSREVGPGARVHYFHAPRFKDLSLSVAWRVNLERETVTRVALVPSVLRRGTRSFPTARDLARRCEELYGCRISSRVYRLGEQQVWWVGLDFPHPRYVEGSGYLEGVLGLLGELLWQPVTEDGGFRSDYVAEEREVLRRALRARFNNKASWANLRCVEEMCAGERYALHPLGREEDLDAIDPRTLYASYRDVLAHGHLDVVAVGDWEALAAGGAADPSGAGVAEILRPLLPRTAGGAYGPGPDGPGEQRPGERRPGPLAPVEVKAARAEVRQVVEHQPVSQSRLVVGLRTTVTVGHDLFPALLFLDGLLGRYAHSRLFVNVREKAGLAYYANTMLDPVKGIVLMVAGIEGKAFQKARDTSLEQLYALGRGEIGNGEWEATYRSLRAEVASWSDDPDGLAWGLLEGLTAGRDFTPAEVVAAVDRVTREQVVEVARRLQPDTVYFLTGEGAAAT